MVILPPAGTSSCVVNEKVATAVVALVVNWSDAAIAMLTDVTFATIITAIAAAALCAFPLAFIVKLLAAANAPPVVSSPAANVILCAPAGNTAVAVVHTILNVAAVIVQVADSVAVPDAGTSTPAASALGLR